MLIDPVNDPSCDIYCIDPLAQVQADISGLPSTAVKVISKSLACAILHLGAQFVTHRSIRHDSVISCAALQD